jgi:heme-degrading monooxygenase HmoA
MRRNHEGYLVSFPLFVAIMILKWIVCSVRIEMRPLFSFAQSKWKGLSKVSGFLGQLGGWDLKSPGDACVIGFWQDGAAYRSFMQNDHDRIFEDSKQVQTYDAIEVALLQPVLPMSGSRPSMISSLGEAKVIRVADCLVQKERVSHFLEAQKKVWLPGMGDAPGMLAGYFNRTLVENIERYVVITIWESDEQHESYVQTMLPQLKREASVEADVEQITGRLITVESNWLVPCTSVGAAGQ